MLILYLFGSLGHLRIRKPLPSGQAAGSRFSPVCLPSTLITTGPCPRHGREHGSGTGAAKPHPEPGWLQPPASLHGLQPLCCLPSPARVHRRANAHEPHLPAIDAAGTARPPQPRPSAGRGATGPGKRMVGRVHLQRHHRLWRWPRQPDRRLSEIPGSPMGPGPLRVLRRGLLLSKLRSKGPWRWTTSCPGTRAAQATSATCSRSASPMPIQVRCFQRRGSWRPCRAITRISVPCSRK